MRHGFEKYFLFFILESITVFSVSGQPVKKHISLKDSLDSGFDPSDYIIDANGFVPVPYIITEPALGGFGGALFPVFIKKRPPYRDSVRGLLQVTPISLISPAVGPFILRIKPGELLHFAAALL